jgi:hypothetical protein
MMAGGLRFALLISVLLIVVKSCCSVKTSIALKSLTSYLNWTTESHCRNVSNRRIKPNIEIAYSWTVLNRSKATTTCRRKTGRYIGGNLLYYPNSVKTTRLFTLQLCGDVELNPGPVTKHPCKDIIPYKNLWKTIALTIHHIFYT